MAFWALVFCPALFVVMVCSLSEHLLSIDTFNGCLHSRATVGESGSDDSLVSRFGKFVLPAIIVDNHDTWRQPGKERVDAGSIMSRLLYFETRKGSPVQRSPVQPHAAALAAFLALDFLAVALARALALFFCTPLEGEATLSGVAFATFLGAFALGAGGVAGGAAADLPLGDLAAFADLADFTCGDGACCSTI